MKLIINQKEYDFFESYEITLRYNSLISEFSFKGLSEFIDDVLFYPEIEIIDDNGNLLLTGTILIPAFSSTNIPESKQIKGYSKTGVLDDCNIPTSSYPLQSDNLSMKQIIAKILDPFGITAISTQNVTNEYNQTIKKITAKPDQSVKAFIQEIANGKDIIITHNEFGEIVFTRLDVSSLKPVARFEIGSPGIMSMNLAINGQNLHSEITVMKEASEDSPGKGEFTIENPYCTDVFRPKVLILSSGGTYDVEKAARKALSDELTSIQLSISTRKFVAPGNLIEVLAPELKINEITEFFVEETTIKGDKSSEDYLLKCTLKEAYTTLDFVNIFDKKKKIATEWGGSKTGVGGPASSANKSDRQSLLEAVQKQNRI